MSEDEPDLPVRPRAWTRAEDYWASLARLRSGRRKRKARPRTQPEAPRAILGTLPFLALIGGLAVLAVAIVIAAWPGRDRAAPKPKPPASAQERGTAPPGWFEEAGREMRN